jgi:hypothetical protein
MPVPSSGAVAISDLVDEFGGTAPHSMSEYYRNGGNVPSNNTNVPTSGAFSLSNARGAVNEIAVAATSGTNIDLSNLFGGNWTSTIPKRLTIGSGITIGGTGSSAAIIIPSNMAGTLEIDNAGTVLGFGGSANSGAGGDAISNSASNVTINNTGLLAGGGGGGGQAGAGGNGTVSSTSTTTVTKFQLSAPRSYVLSDAEGGETTYYWEGTLIQYPHVASYNGGATFTQGSLALGSSYFYITRTGPTTTTTSTTGGAGGAGGVGQGYNQSNTSGSAGSAGGTNAGTGGTGGAGSTYGIAGLTGGTGANGNATSGVVGNAGGAAGAAVAGTSITMNNTGTLHGAVA